MDSIQAFGAERAAAMRREAARLFMPACVIFVTSMCLAGIFNRPLLPIVHVLSGLFIGFGGLLFLRFQIIAFASLMWLILLVIFTVQPRLRSEQEYLGPATLAFYLLIITIWGSLLFRKAAFILLSQEESNWNRFSSSELITVFTVIAMSFGCTMNIPHAVTNPTSNALVSYWLPINLLVGSATVWITSIYRARSRTGYERKI